MYVAEKKDKSIFKTYLIYFICVVTFLFVRIGYADGWLFNNLDALSADVLATITIQVGIMFLLPITLYCLLLKQTPKNVFKEYHYSKLSFVSILVCVAIGIIAFIITVVLSTLFSGIISFLGYKQNMATTSVVEYNEMVFAIRIITVAILPALCEEFLHRGMILQGTRHSGFKKSILISALFFGLVHFNINQVFYAFALGLLMGLIAVVAKNIWPAIIVHFINNFISVYLEFASYKHIFGHNFYDTITNFFTTTNFFVAFLTMFFSIILLVVVLGYLIFALYKSAIIKKVERAINNVYGSDNFDTKNAPIDIGQFPEVKNVLESTTVLNLNVEEVKSPIDIVMPKQNKIYKTTFKDNIFLIAVIVLGTLVTLFTFIWGLF